MQKIKLPRGNKLCISCTHAPFMADKYPSFLAKIIKEYNITTTVHLGDVFDQYSLSRFATDPESMSGGRELTEAKSQIKKLAKVLDSTKVYYMLGNHDMRIYKKLIDSSIPKDYLKDYKDIYGISEEWTMVEEFYDENDNIFYTHGEQFGHGSAMALCAKQIQSTNYNLVIGHQHSKMCVDYHTSPFRSVWGMQAGCGINIRKYAFQYTAKQRNRPIVGAGILTYKGKKIKPLVEAMEL